MVSIWWRHISEINMAFSRPLDLLTLYFLKHSVLGIFIAFSINNLNSVYILDYQIGSVCKEINNIYCTATINTMLYKGFFNFLFLRDCFLGSKYLKTCKFWFTFFLTEHAEIKRWKEKEIKNNF